MSHNRQGRTNVSPPHASEGDVLPVDSESEALDPVFRALADHRRRCVCHYLARRDDPLGVNELAELLAASMSEKTSTVLTSAEIEQTRRELVQTHLPELVEAGIVEHDEEQDTVALVDVPGVRECLDAAEGADLR